MKITAKFKEFEEIQEFMPGFPHYIYTSGGGALRYFEIKMDCGEVLKAYVDPSRQYASEGLEWKRADTNQTVNKYRVVGFRCIDGTQR